MNGICALQPSFLTLANNHIMDHGVDGLENTIKQLDCCNIAYGGVGNNISEAKKENIFEIDGSLVGIYCCAEHEYSIATEENAGANPYDPLESFDDVATLKEKCDIVIVLFHGGKEYYRYPSPNLQRIFRKFAEKGADVVVAQHTHCIGAFEKYNDSYLVYGQGNFIFDGGDDEFWNTGMLISLKLFQGKIDKVEFILYEKNNGGKIQYLSGEKRVEIMSSFRKRSEEILDTVFVKNMFSNYAKEHINDYLNYVHGDNLLYKLLRKVMGTKIAAFMYSSPYGLNMLLNHVECEAHNEMLVNGIKSIH